MRGIERLIAGALLVMAVTGTAVLARTSAPGGGQAGTVRLQSPPRSRVVAPLPVVVASPETPPRPVIVHRSKPPAPPLRATVALATPIEVPPVAPSVPASPPAPAAPAAPAEPAPAPPPAAPVPAAAPAPTPAPSPVPAARVVAAAPAQPAPLKTYGHSHPRGHAWGQVKHAVTTLSAGDSQMNDGAQGQARAPAAAVPPVAPPPPAPTPAPATQPPSDADNDNGNGNGHAWGHSKHDRGN